MDKAKQLAAGPWQMNRLSGAHTLQNAWSLQAAIRSLRVYTRPPSVGGLMNGFGFL
jgi:hypothetical protein